MTLLSRLQRLEGERTQGVWTQWFVTTPPQENPAGEFHPLIHGAAPPHEFGDHNPDAIKKAGKDAEFIKLASDSMHLLLAVVDGAKRVLEECHQYNIENDGCTSLIQEELYAALKPLLEGE